MGSILVTGTLAYDEICFHADDWSETTRNVKLTRIESGYGGCAMNIAYNLQKLKVIPLPVVHAGVLDYDDYARHLARLNITNAGVIPVADARCSRAIVFTGPDGTQTTAFYPGPATTHQSVARINELRGDHPIDGAIIAPDLPPSMLEIASALSDAVNRVWCPGQYADRLTDDCIHAIAPNIDTLIVNRHEFQAMQRFTDDVQSLYPVVVITDGSAPVTIVADGRTVVVDVPTTQMLDPTGCGDAFTAGFVGGQLAGKDLAESVREGIALASQCLARYGAQAH